VGLEFRPVKSLLVRGRYGTAFKAPTLSDEFQGQSGFFVTTTDYYTCAKHGFAPGNPPPNDIASCPQANQTYFGTTEGNPKLKPINAKVADIGLVWSPLERSSFSVDYLHWKIDDEVFVQDSDQLLRLESACRLGQLDPTSPSCVAALSQVQRDPTTGLIIQFNTPKLNLSEEKLGVLLFTLNYTWLAGKAGSFTVTAAYTNVLNHSEVRFPGDPRIDLLNSPFYSTEFKTKENLALTWNLGKFATTVYIERYGKTPNFVSTQAPEGFATPGSAWLQPWTITNWEAEYEALPGLTLRANVDNVFNRSPPFDNSYRGIDNQPYNIFNYNDFGRTYFVGATYRLHP
jgi:iron complex outermembrane recepter protein